MSNQDRAAKARDKAFRKAAEYMNWTIPVEGIIEQHRDVWTLIWDRALRYADKWWDKQLEEVRGRLEKVCGEAVLLSLDLNQAREAVNTQTDEVARLRIENDRLRGQVQNQTTFLRGSRESAARLRKERDELKVAMTEMADKVHSESFDELLERNGIQARVISELTEDLGEARRDLDAKERALRLENLRNNNLRRRLDTCEAQLNEARALTTRGTTTVFDENERLVAEVHRLTSLLADEEEKVTYLKDLNGRLHVDLATLRDRLAAATEPPRPATLTKTTTCNAVSGPHRCTNRMFYERPHVQSHLCHCGSSWA